MAVREKTRAQLFNLSPHSHAEQASAGGEKSEKKFHWFTQNDLFLQGSEWKQMQTNKQDTEEFRFSDSVV